MKIDFPAHPKAKFNIDTTLDLMYQDEGPWRGYTLAAQGETLYELMENATISEIDQDGGELRCYGLFEASNTVFKEAIDAFEFAIAFHTAKEGL